MSTTHQSTIRLRPDDPIAVATDKLAAGTDIDGVTLNKAIPRGHKFALEAIASGEPVRKYGQIIGFAKEDIAPGDHVHTHNLAFGSADRLPPLPQVAKGSAHPEDHEKRWLGYHRADGRVGTRNFIGVLTSVNCSATVAHLIASEAEKRGIFADLPNVDGVIGLSHGTGCGMADRGEPFQRLERTLWGTATNPNFGGVLMVGLGCEVFQLPRLRKTYGIPENAPFKSMTIQESGGTTATVEAGLRAVRELALRANTVARSEAPISALSLALQCGGSDGFSGITANPALGVASDRIVAAGGTTVLAETPEIYGAEHMLMARAVNDATREKLSGQIDWWEKYTAMHGVTLDANPSPGNIAGGITTILEKSLGAVAKGGSASLAGVLNYSEPIDRAGFLFMDSPGYDPCSVTGQIASGCNIVAFTTGRGSAFGSRPSPSIKLSTTSDLYSRMSDDVDVDCGTVLDGQTLDQVGGEILDCLLRVASGEKSKSETHDYGRHEFVPWQIGAVL